MIGKKLGSAFVVMALLLAAAVPAASAYGSQQSKDRRFRVEMVPVDLFYGDFDRGLLLFAGLTPNSTLFSCGTAGETQNPNSAKKSLGMDAWAFCLAAELGEPDSTGASTTTSPPKRSPGSVSTPT